MDLDFVRIECEITADSPVQLAAALYDTLRNFEPRFKDSCCPILQERCISCVLHDGCPYRLVFDQTLSSDSEIVRLHQKPSLPFSLYIDGINGYVLSCAVGLVVIGSAVNYLGFFHTALQRMIEDAVSTVLPLSKCTLRYYCLDYQGDRHEIASGALLPESAILLSGQHILRNTVHSDKVRLFLKSPLRLLSYGSIAHRFDFCSFFRSQLRRCSSLYAYYGTGEIDLDFAGLTLSAQNVTVFEDGMHYIQPPWSKRLNRAGLTGSADCYGLVEPMFSLLRLGSYFNAGKGAAFGLGYYQIEVL